MAHSHCPPMDYTEATLKLGGGKNGAFSFSSHGLQPKVVSHDKVASNRKSTTNFIFIHYRQNFQWVDAPLRLGVAGMAHSQFFLPTMVFLIYSKYFPKYVPYFSIVSFLIYGV